MPHRCRSLRLLSRLAALAPASSIALLAACAESTPPPAAPPVVAPPPPPPPPDTSPVPSPANLVFYGRASNPAASLKIATDWARLPSLDAGALVEEMISSMTKMQGKATAKLASVVDVGQPLDFAAAFEVKLPPKELGAFSAAITNLDAAKASLAAAFDLRAGERGVVMLSPRDQHPAEASTPDDEDSPACELAPAAGAAPYRLVCGSNLASLAALGPYLTRTTPRQAVPVDIHLELHTASVAGFATLGRVEGPKLVGRLLGLDPVTEPARAELVNEALGDIFDVVGDTDAVTLDATLDPAHAGLLYRTTFKSTTSWIARVSTGHPERADVPPSAFWRLSADVDAASFGGGVDEADMRRPRDLVVAAFDEALGKEKLAAADRTALVELVRESIRGTGGLLAHGKAAGASYWVLEWNEAAPAIQKVARDIAAARLRPGILKWAGTDAQKLAALPSLKLAGPLSWLPAGSLHALLTVTTPPPGAPSSSPASPLESLAKSAKGAGSPPKPAKPAKGAVTAKPVVDVYHVAIMPDGPRAWVAFSTSEAALRIALGSVAGPTPPPNSLGANAAGRALDTFKDTRMTAGGFVTVRAFTDLARVAMDGQTDPRWDAVLARLPSKGVTPITFTATPLPPTAEDPGGVREIRLHVPAEAIRDLVWFGLQADGLKHP